MFARFNRYGMLGLSVCAIASISGATQAPAQNGPVVVYGEPSAVNTERVPYGDLNLQAATGRRTLYGRVGRAVRNVCDFGADSMSSDYRVCSAGAWKGARPQIDAAMAKATQLALHGRPAGGALIVVTR
ncbi:MAG: UrcA family protein [Pseudomonadota bacterium]|nr:UrcA family protein [Pseudomonadota bacterium]